MQNLAIAALLFAAAAPLAAQTGYSTLFGQGGAEWIYALETDAQGRIYVCGQTDATTHVTASAFQPQNAGGVDAFVACLDPGLPPATQLVWSTHFGGSGDEAAYDLHVDPTGAVVTIVGQTTSADLPVQGGHQMQHGGGDDAFVAVFTVAGAGAAQLQWATYLGGSGDEGATSVAVQGSMVTVAGTTDSTDFPTLAPWQPANAGMRDLFVSQLTTSGSLSWSTYLGGVGVEADRANPAHVALAADTQQFFELLFARATQVAVDDLGRVTVVSYTASPDFPNPNNRVHGVRGGWDLCVTRFDASGSALLYSAILGGSFHDFPAELELDGPDRIVVAGSSWSPDFPVSAPAPGPYYGLVLHLDLAQDTLLLAAPLGAASTWDSYAMALYREPGGTFVVGGFTVAPDFPVTTGAPMTTKAAFAQSFLARVRPSSSPTIQYATFWGGSGDNLLTAIAPDGKGGVVNAGGTLSLDHPTTSNALDATFGGVTEGWVAVHHMLPAVVTPFGHATNPCGPTTYLQLNSAPLAPNPGFTVETHDAPPGAFGTLVLGAPLTAGATYLNAEAFLGPIAGTLTPVLADTTGFAAHPLSVPPGFSWDGRVALQSIWLTPASCSGGPFAVSNALR